MAYNAVSVGAVSVVASATLIHKEDGNRGIIRIYNAGTAIVYVGSGTAVTTANGYPLAANGGELVFTGIDALYGIAAGGTCDVRYFNA